MSRHTEPMTDAYIAAERLRNAARVQCAIQQLGNRWVLHPDNAVTRESHLEVRRARAERIDLRWYQLVGAVQELRLTGGTPVFLDGSDEANAAQDSFDSSLHGPTIAQMQKAGLLIEHEGGAQ